MDLSLVFNALHDIVWPIGPSPPLGNAMNLIKRLIGPSDHRPPLGEMPKAEGVYFPSAAMLACFPSAVRPVLRFSK